MPFYLRKSVKVGPLRFNLSKSGVGVSAGVKGFRVGSGPRGNYVHMGRGGLYYRASLDSQGPRSSQPRPASLPVSTHMEDIDSAAISAMIDASASGLLTELNEKRKGWRYWPWVVVAGFIVSAYLPESPSFLRLASLSAFLALAWWVAQRDALRLTTVLMYDLEGEAVGRYQRLHDAFDVLLKAGRVGHISARGGVVDRKRNAGAGHVVKRHVIKCNKAAPARVATNVEVPAIPVGKQTLHFFPDRLLVFDRDGVGAVAYTDLGIEVSESRFIETDGVPKDAKVVDRTWEYVNKNGGPDKRFKNNRELPIALYDAIHFTSPTGLNELLQVSRPGTGAALRDAIVALKVLDSARQRANLEV